MTKTNSQNRTWTEDERLAALYAFEVLDTPQEPEFDDIVKLAAEICGTPISLITLVETERQWFKAKTGIAAEQTPIEVSICATAMLEEDLFVVPDTQEDQRFNCNPLVTGDPHLRFYAGAPLETADKIPLGMLCVLDTKPRDLTPQQGRMLQALARQVMTQLELRRALRDKHRSEQRLQLAFKASEVAGFWHWDLRNGLVVTDERFAKIYGVDPRQAAAGAPIDAFTKNIHPEDIGRISRSIERTLFEAANYIEEYRILQPDGSVVWVAARGNTHPDAQGRPQRFDGVLIDITERKAKEQALSESEAFTKSIVNSSTDVIKVLDLEGRLLSMNDAGAVQNDIDDVRDVLGQVWVDFWVGPEQEAARRALDAARRGQSDRFEGFFATMKGVAKWWEVITSPINGADGKPVRILVVSRDMTARKKLETETREAREMAEAANLAKTEFLATMSHEIRTPMNAVIGLASILAVSQPLTDRQKDFIATLQASAGSLLSLINDLLDIARIEARSVELEHIPFSLSDVLREVGKMMEVRVREKNLHFALEDTGVRSDIFVGDPSRLRQILVNLCSNAIKFTDGGYVRVTAQRVSGAGSSAVIGITVEDSGIGIEPSHLETIFEKFVQADQTISRRYGGTGLGLAITKTLTELMGGTIAVTSKVGRGSRFEVRIPLEISSASPVLSPAAETEGAVASLTALVGDRPRLLLVEDYEPNVLVATTFLEEFGYLVDVASDGLEAIEKVQKGGYSLVLMDVQMHGMNGFTATQKIRAYEAAHRLPRIPIIGMTAHALSGDRARCIEVGMDDYISKPFRPEHLEQLIADVVNGSPSRLASPDQMRRSG